ncbi:MAG TPA: PAS domain-containing protein, partial [Thiobacillaceae bacterium]
MPVDLRRIVVLTVLLGLAFSALLAVPFVFYERAESDNNLRLLQAEQERVTKLAVVAIRQEMDAVLSDLRYLSQQNEVRSFLAHDTPGNRLGLATEYLALVSQKNLYDQIRFIGANGMEEVRVDFNAGRPAIVAEPKLRDRRHRYYFEETLRLSPGQIYVSPLELNLDPAAGQQPKPVIRFATPVADAEGRIRGMVVLNYQGQRLRDKLGELDGHAGRIRLLNAQGHWLIGAAPEDEWEFMYPGRPQHDLATVSPRLWKEMEASASGIGRTNGSWIRFERVYPLLGENAPAAGAIFPRPVDADRYYWTVAVELSQSALQAANQALRERLRTVYGALALFAFLVAGALAFAISRNRALAQVMEKVVDNVPVLVAYVDTEQRYRFNNMAYERFFGLKPKQIYGRTMQELLGDDDYRKARPYIEQALAGKAVSFERQLRHVGEGMRDVTISYLPDTAPNGEARGFYVMVNDVTPIKASQRRERQHLHELAHVSRLASMGEMATEIAHEINQPLAAIAMYSSAGLRILDECDRSKMQ